MINNLQSILSQSSLGTEAPIYCVYSKREICVDGDFEFDKIIYVKNGDDDYPELTYEEFEELEEQYNSATDYRSIEVDSSGEQIFPEMPKDPCSGEDFDPDDWEKRYIKYTDKFEQAFFIRQNAQDFIDRNSHNLGRNAHIYVESAYRNPEWQAIREMLIEAAKKNENKFGELKFGLEYEDIVDGMWVVYTELPLSNYANSLKQINKIENGWREKTISVEWGGKYVVSINEHSFTRSIWDEKCYALVDYNGKDDPVEFMSKILPLTIKGTQDA